MKEGPRLGDTMLKPWATDAQRVGTRCPRLGQPCLMRFLIVVLYLDNVWIYPFLAFIYTIYGL